GAQAAGGAGLPDAGHLRQPAGHLRAPLPGPLAVDALPRAGALSGQRCQRIAQPPTADAPGMPTRGGVARRANGPHPLLPQSASRVGSSRYDTRPAAGGAANRQPLLVAPLASGRLASSSL